MPGIEVEEGDSPPRSLPGIGPDGGYEAVCVEDVDTKVVRVGQSARARTCLLEVGEEESGQEVGASIIRKKVLLTRASLRSNPSCKTVWDGQGVRSCHTAALPSQTLHLIPTRVLRDIFSTPDAPHNSHN